MATISDIQFLSIFNIFLITDTSYAHCSGVSPKSNLKCITKLNHRHLVTVIKFWLKKWIDRALYLYTERLLASINGSALRALWFLFQFGVQLQNRKPTISSSCFNVELNCKIGSQLLSLFENMGLRRLQYFLLYCLDLWVLFRNYFTVIFTYRTV